MNLIGIGGVGLNILRACVLRQANPVIFVDLEKSKEDLGREFGEDINDVAEAMVKRRVRSRWVCAFE
jgi:Zn-dependent alcohol dehydrogenase